MCSGIAFLAGLFFLFRGQFRINNRQVPRNQGRLLGVILMAPLAISLLLSPGIFTAAGEIDWAAAERAVVLELGVLVIALGLSAYLIYSIPPSPDMARVPYGVNAPPRAPDIMTVQEAAAYLRVSEVEVLSLIENGRLGAARIGDTYRIARIAIEDFMQRNQANPGEPS